MKLSTIAVLLTSVLCVATPVGAAVLVLVEEGAAVPRFHF